MLPFLAHEPHTLDRPLRGTFRFPLDRMHRFDVLTSLSAGSCGGIRITLTEKESGKLICRSSLDGGQVENGGYSSFVFEPVVDSGGRIYEFLLEAAGEPYAILWRHPTVTFPEIELSEGGSINCRIYSAADQDEVYQFWASRYEPDPSALDAQRSFEFKQRPLISLVVPVHDTPAPVLKEMIESVIAQTYSHWELCMADGNSQREETRRTLELYAAQEKRIKVNFLTKNTGIAGNSNEALKLASGDYIGLLDHDDTLAPFALFEAAKVIDERPEVDFIYSDRDFISSDGKVRLNPFFKPDFSPYFLLSSNYLTHLWLFRRELIDKLEGFRLGFEGAQDYDLVLRATELTDRIVHIPKILYHWRKTSTSAALSPRAKPYAFDSGAKAVAEALKRRGMPGQVKKNPEVAGLYSISLRPRTKGLCSIMIPAYGNVDKIARCVSSIVKNTKSEKLELIVVGQKSQQEMRKKLAPICARCPVQFIDGPEPKNIFTAFDAGAQSAKGDFLLFAHDDIEVSSKDWLADLKSWCEQGDIGIASGKILYPDNTIQCTGLFVSKRGDNPSVGTAHRNIHKDNPAYAGMVQAVREYSAVSAVCMMIRKDVYDAVGGFDAGFKISLGDIDLCLKTREKGYRVLYVPSVELYHHEPKTKAFWETVSQRNELAQDSALFMKKWHKRLAATDPHYNPNLDQEYWDFSLKL